MTQFRHFLVLYLILPLRIQHKIHFKNGTGVTLTALFLFSYRHELEYWGIFRRMLPPGTGVSIARNSQSLENFEMKIAVSFFVIAIYCSLIQYIFHSFKCFISY